MAAIPNASPEETAEPTSARSEEFRLALEEHPLIADGGMGTSLLARLGGLSTPNRPFLTSRGLPRCLEEMNLSRAAIVRDVHREFLEAGVQIIGTNTFGANRARLKTHGLADQVKLINRIGVRIAREAARAAAAEDTAERAAKSSHTDALDADPPDVASKASASENGAKSAEVEQLRPGTELPEEDLAAFVAGVIGPTGVRLEPFGSMTAEEAQEVFAEQVEGLQMEGVDLFLLETFRDLAELEAAVAAIREVAGDAIAVAAEVSLEEDGRLQDGTPVENIGRRLDKLPVDLIGVNCSSGPRSVLDAIEKLVSVTEKPLIAMPSAGIPGSGRYPVSPEYFARYAQRLLEAGASIVGGCCGTTGEHLTKVVDMADELEPAELPARAAVKPAPEVEPEPVQPTPLEKKSALGRKLAAGEFVTLIELPLPRSHSATEQVAAARQCAKAGIDAVSFAAGYRARGRLSTSATCLVVQAKAKIETVLYLPCRGRSLTALESDLLGAQAVGLDNVLCLTGEGPGSSEIDSIGLLRVAGRLNQGEDLGGNPNPPATTLLLGVAANPYASDLDHELERLARKIDAGAEFIITQPVFSADMVKEFAEKVKALGEQAAKIPLIVSVHPVLSLREADYLAGEMGLPLPESLLNRLTAAADGATTAKAKEKAVADEGLEIAREIARSLDGVAQGLRVVASDETLDAALEIAASVTGEVAA